MNNIQKIDTTLSTLAKHTPVAGTFVPTLNTMKTGIDGNLQLVVPEIKIPKLNVILKGTLRQYQLLELLDLAAAHRPFIVYADTIYPTLKEELRRRRINYIDAAGNLFVHHKQIILLIEGQKKAPKPPKERVNKAFTKTGLKVIFYFLLHPDAVNYPYRQIATATGVALGNIKNILDGLHEAGFLLAITKERYELQRKKELLQRWINGYDYILRPTLYLGAYQFTAPQQAYRWQQLPLDITKHRWGAEPAGDQLTHDLQAKEFQVYTADKTDLVKQWRLIPAENGEIRFYQKFWKDDDADATTNIAPILLVYTDLLLTNDPRCLETAEKIYDQYLKNEFN